MADLGGTVRWVTYVPDLLGNRDLEKPFYFELNGSLSKEQLHAFTQSLDTPLPTMPELAADATDDVKKARDEELRKAHVAKQTSALQPFVRFGKEPLNVGSQRIETLEQYFDFVSREFLSFGLFLEPSAALIDANSLSARVGFSSGRLSGGFGSTTRPSGARGTGQTAAR